MITPDTMAWRVNKDGKRGYSPYGNLSQKDKIAYLEANYLGPKEQVERELAIGKGELEYAKMGRNFEVMLKTAETNELTDKAWKQFMLALKMVGFDGSR